MSAIAGIYFLDERPVESADLSRMLDAMAHRGPDGSSLWSCGPVGLGQTFFLTTPEARREQLGGMNGTDLVIAADARLDNRDELMSSLDINDRPSLDVADSELIVRAYAKWGDACASKLLGDFAFAIWDPARQSFFCARDHFGIKPFYYYRSHHVFAFASQIKPLLCLPDVPRQLNEMKVAHYLLSTLEDHEATFYQHLVRLPPAHSMTVSRQAAHVRRYWALDPTRESRYRSDEEYAGAFRQVFTEAVRCRLRSTSLIGSMLSGGLDSSSIVCVARDLLGKEQSRRLHTFSAVFPDRPECDERPFIDAVVSGNGLRPHFVRCDRLTPLSHLADSRWGIDDQPLYAPNLFMLEAICRAAKNEGVRVLLDGIDGDTTVSHGLLYLAELVSARKWRALANEVGPLSTHFKRNRWKLLWAYGLKPNVPRPVRTLWRATRGRARLVRLANPTIKREFADRLKLQDRLAEAPAGGSQPARTARQDQWLRLTSEAFPSAFELLDKAAAVFQIELRHPFFDRRLVEFCLALPPEQKLRDGWTRAIMRHALNDSLPEKIRWRGGKTYLDTNFVHNFIGFERPALEAFVLAPPRIIDAYVDTAALRRVYRRYSARKTKADALTIWKAVTLGRWLERTERAG